jgi:hypothetical protein
MVWLYLSLVALWRGQCSRKWAVVSVAPHWQIGEFTMFLRNKWWLRELPQNFGMIHDHNTRHTSRIAPVRTRTSLYASYFIPSNVQLWNQQPENIKSSRSVQIIKSNLLPQNNTKPIYCDVRVRTGAIREVWRVLWSWIMPKFCGIKLLRYWGVRLFIIL